MNSVRGNILANIINTAWLALLMLILTPMYKGILGDEGFALVGFFMTLQLLCAPLDAGFRGTVGRELAHLKVQPDSAEEMWSLLLTLQRVYLVTMALIFLAVSGASGLIARYWLASAALPIGELTVTVVCMAFALAAQWPFFLYAGALTGLEKQVPLAALNLAMYTARYVGAFLVLRYVSGAVTAFLLWQGGVCLVHSVFARILLQRSMPPRPAAARAQWSILRRHRDFTLGVGILVTVNVVLLQLDRIYLSNTNLCAPAVFSQYVLAFIVATLVLRIVDPISQAVFPRLTSMVGLGEEDKLIALYHRGSQFAAVMVGAPALLLCLFAPQFLWVWTGRMDDVSQTTPLLRGLSLATYFWAMSRLPERLQMAYKSVRLLAVYSAATLVILIPVMGWMILRYQALGAIVSLLVFHGLRLVVLIPLIHRRFLRRDLWRWYVWDLAIPALAMIGVGMGVRYLVPENLGRWMTLPWLAGAGVALLAAGTIVSPALREQIVYAVEKYVLHRSKSDGTRTG
jgi:O-antigen/teichoic acid export membrane protein